MSKDYYNILGVSKDASQDDIKKAFRKKAHEHHPDKGGDDAKFKEVNEAHQVLGNAEKRKQYDQFGSSFQNGQAGGGGGFGGFQNGMNFDMDDLGDMFGGFGDIFGFGGGRKSSQGPTRGRDMEMIINLDFLEAAFGGEKEISFSKMVVCTHCKGEGAEPGAKIDTCGTCNGQGKVNRVQRTILGNIQTQATCSSCQGEGKIYSKKCTKCHGGGTVRDNVKIKVKIPAGINTGESIRLSGQGEAGQKGAGAGDLYLRVKVAIDKRFVRDYYDIKTEEKINFTQASLGDKIDVETIHGKVKLKIPEGTQSSTVFRLKDKGIEKLHGRGKGDHLVRVIVEIPKHLTKKQKDILKELNL